jgi:hypothetical protein
MNKVMLCPYVYNTVPAWPKLVKEMYKNGYAFYNHVYGYSIHIALYVF